MRRTALLGVASAALAGAVVWTAVPASAGAGPVHVLADAFTSTMPASSSGRVFDADFVNPADPAAKPPAQRRVLLSMAAGARFDTTAVAQCHAADAELLLLGASACPPGSRLGEDTVIVDTGVPGPERDVTVEFLAFNNRDQLILLGEDPHTGARLVVVRGAVHDNVLDITFPTIPGTPPDGGALKQERGTFPAASGSSSGRTTAYLVTPPTCPSSGSWTNTVTYWFRDGTTQTVASSSPCSPGRGPQVAAVQGASTPGTTAVTAASAGAATLDPAVGLPETAAPRGAPAPWTAAAVLIPALVLRRRRRRLR